MPSLADAESLRLAQVGVRSLVEADVRDFWSSLDLSRPEASRAALLEYVPQAVSSYGDAAAVTAADWYDEARATQAVPGRFRATMQPSPYLDATDGSAHRLAGGLFTPDPAAVLTGLLSVMGKYVLAAARQTVVANTDADPQARGWQRVTRPGACDFCRMLAGRGGVYTRQSVHFAAHGHCNCASVPSWDPKAREVDAPLYEASARTTAMTPEQRERHNALIRRAIAQYVH